MLSRRDTFLSTGKAVHAETMISQMAAFPGFEATPTPLPNAIEPKAELLTAIRTRKDVG